MPANLLFATIDARDVWPKKTILCPVCQGDGWYGEKNLKLFWVFYDTPEYKKFLASHILEHRVEYLNNPNHENRVSSIYLACPICDGDGRLSQGPQGIVNITRWDQEINTTILNEPTKPPNILLREYYRLRNILYGKN